MGVLWGVGCMTTLGLTAGCQGQLQWGPQGLLQGQAQSPSCTLTDQDGARLRLVRVPAIQWQQPQCLSAPRGPLPALRVLLPLQPVWQVSQELPVEPTQLAHATCPPPAPIQHPRQARKL